MPFSILHITKPTWTYLVCTCVDDVSTWRQLLFFSWTAHINFSSRTCWNNGEMISEAQSRILKWRRRSCWSSPSIPFVDTVLASIRVLRNIPLSNNNNNASVNSSCAQPPFPRANPRKFAFFSYEWHLSCQMPSSGDENRIIANVVGFQIILS